MEDKKPKIIQIAASECHSPKVGFSWTIAALCDDGSIWIGDIANRQWTHKMPEIPTEKNEKEKKYEGDLPWWAKK